MDNDTLRLAASLARDLHEAGLLSDTSRTIIHNLNAELRNHPNLAENAIGPTVSLFDKIPPVGDG